jgi:hypothetical protein
MEDGGLKMKWKPFVAVALMIVMVGPASAGSFLDIRPGLVELSSPPGRVIKGHFVITNSTDKEIQFNIKVEDGWAQQVGQPSPIPPDQWFSLKIPKKRVIRANRDKKIPYRIQVPTELTGEVLVLVFFSGLPQAGPSESVGVQFRHGIPIYLSARGTEQATLSVTKARGSFIGEGGLTILSTLASQGNAHVRPRGEWIVTDFFGQEVDRIPLDYGMPIFPGSSRDYPARSKRTGSWASGPYKARLFVTYGELWGEAQPFEKTFDLQVADQKLTFSEETAHAP